jgi:hypothetical protein
VTMSGGEIGLDRGLSDAFKRDVALSILSMSEH